MEFLDVSLDSLIQKKTTIKGKGTDGKRKTFNKGSTKVVAKAAGPRKFVGKNVLTQPYAAPRRPKSASSGSRPSSAISHTHNNINNSGNRGNSARPASIVSSTAAAAAALERQTMYAAGGGDGNILHRLGGGNGSIGSGTMITISNLNLDILPRYDILPLFNSICPLTVTT